MLSFAFPNSPTLPFTKKGTFLRSYSKSLSSIHTRPLHSNYSQRPKITLTPTTPQMSAGTFVTAELEPTDYVVLGLATWFRRNKKNRKILEEVRVIEPIASSSLEVITKAGVPTSYSRVAATTLGELSDDTEELPHGLVEGFEKDVVYGEDFAERVRAAARTYRRRPEAKKLVQIGKIVSDLNYSTEKKRMLNEDWEPSFDDNVKQDRSIDVYGRNNDDTGASEIEKLYNA